MTLVEFISLVITFIGVFSFAALFTILYNTYANSQINEIKSGKRDIEIIDEVIYERQTKIINKRKRNKIIKTISYYLALLIIVPLFVLALISKINNDVLMINNRSIMVVASNSMSEINKQNNYLKENNLLNQFSKYDIIVLKKVNSIEDIKLYDIVCYKNEENINIIHRVIDIKYEDETKLVMRGDANNANDKFTPTISDIVGVYTEQKIKGFGIIIMFLQSYAGIITICSLIYCIMMIDKSTQKIYEVQNERIKQLEQVIDYSGNKLDTLKATYHEIIKYDGYAYHFDESGFIEKKKIDEKGE